MSKHKEVIESAKFKSLVRNRWAFSLLMASIMLLVYFGFLLGIAFSKESFGIKLANGLTVGVLFGLGLIIMAWVMTGIYVLWANSYYDDAVAELKEAAQK